MHHGFSGLCSGVKGLRFHPFELFPDVFTPGLLLILLDDLGAFHPLISRNLFINQTFFAAALVMIISHLRLHCLLAKS